MSWEVLIQFVTISIRSLGYLKKALEMVFFGSQPRVVPTLFAARRSSAGVTLLYFSFKTSEVWKKTRSSVLHKWRFRPIIGCEGVLGRTEL